MKLRSSTNNPAIEQEIICEAENAIGLEHDNSESVYALEAVFEHGQWFLVCRCGAQWSVNDSCYPNGEFKEYDFERISDGEDGFHETEETN